MIMACWDVIPCNFEKKKCVAIIFGMFYPKDADVELFQNVKFTTKKKTSNISLVSRLYVNLKNALKTAHLLIGATLLNVNTCIA
jgi:hypothetical protein